MHAGQGGGCGSERQSGGWSDRQTGTGNVGVGAILPLSLSPAIVRHVTIPTHPDFQFRVAVSYLAITVLTSCNQILPLHHGGTVPSSFPRFLLLVNRISYLLVS